MLEVVLYLPSEWCRLQFAIPIFVLVLVAITQTWMKVDAEAMLWNNTLKHEQMHSPKRNQNKLGLVVHVQTIDVSGNTVSAVVQDCPVLPNAVFENVKMGRCGIVLMAKAFYCMWEKMIQLSRVLELDDQEKQQ
jgi:hypothetical protein